MDELNAGLIIFFTLVIGYMTIRMLRVERKSRDFVIRSKNMAEKYRWVRAMLRWGEKEGVNK